MLNSSIATQTIQIILSPAVMVSATALFLLGLNTRYVALITRIRLLNDERRMLRLQLNQDTKQSTSEYDRLLSIDHQLNVLRLMTWYLRNAILCQVLAAIFFISTSCLIGVYFWMTIRFIDELAIVLFMIGLVLLLSGVIFLGMDILKSYRLIGLEIGDRASG